MKCTSRTLLMPSKCDTIRNCYVSTPLSTPNIGVTMDGVISIKSWFCCNNLNQYDIFNVKISTNEIWLKKKWQLICAVKFHDWNQTWNDAMGNRKPSSSAWLAIAQSWNKVFDIIVFIISSISIGIHVKGVGWVHDYGWTKHVG
jgi:hypothetical protein